MVVRKGLATAQLARLSILRIVFYEPKITKQDLYGILFAAYELIPFAVLNVLEKINEDPI